MVKINDLLTYYILIKKLCIIFPIQIHYPPVEKVIENGCKVKSKQTVYILCLDMETKRIRASGDCGRCTKQRSNVTSERENTMAKEKV